MSIKIFDVHGIKIGIEASSARLHRDLEHQLRFFRTLDAASTITDVDISIQDYCKKPEMVKVQTASNKYFYSDGLLDIPAEKICFNISEKRHRYYLDSFQIPVNLILQLFLQNIGKTLVHSAGISINGITILCPALSGIGKTTIVSYAMKNNGKLYGDDLCIMDDNAVLYPYPIDFSVYDYHYDLLGLEKKLNVKIFAIFRTGLKIFDKIPVISLFTKRLIAKFFPPSQNISPLIIYGEDCVADVSKASKISYVGRHFNGERPLIHEYLNNDEMAKRLTSVLIFEWRDSVEFLKIYSTFSRKFSYLDMCNNIKDIFLSAISNTELEAISIDASLTNEEYLDLLMRNYILK